VLFVPLYQIRAKTGKSIVKPKVKPKVKSKED